MGDLSGVEIEALGCRTLSGWQQDDDTYRFVNVSYGETYDHYRTRIFDVDKTTGNRTEVTSTTQIGVENDYDFTYIRYNPTTEFFPYPGSTDKFVCVRSWDRGGLYSPSSGQACELYDLTNGTKLGTLSRAYFPEGIDTGNGGWVNSPGVMWSDRAGYSTNSIPMPHFHTSGNYTSHSKSARVDRAAWVQLVTSYVDAGSTGTNIFAIRWELDEDADESYVATVTTVPLATDDVINKFSIQEPIMINGQLHFLLYTDSYTAMEAVVNPWTCEVSWVSANLNNFPVFKSYYDFMIAEGLSHSQFVENHFNRPTGNRTGISLNHVSQKVRSLDDTDLSVRTITPSGVQDGQTDTIISNYASFGVHGSPCNNSWPRGHSNFESTKTTVQISTFITSNAYVFDYVFYDPPIAIEAPPGDCSSAPGGAGYTVVEGDDVNSWYLVDENCEPVARGSLPATGLLRFIRIGRLIYVYGGGALLASYIIPQATWDNLSIEDQSYIGWYTNGVASDPPQGVTVTIIAPPSGGIYLPGSYEAPFVDDGGLTLFRKLGTRRQGLEILYDGSDYYVSDEFSYEQRAAATKRWRGGREERETLTYDEAVGACTAYGSAEAVEVTWDD